jgi:hypothetical protein
MTRLPTELYSVDRDSSTAELEFWWSEGIETRDQAREHFVEFIGRQGLAVAPSAHVEVDLLDEFRLLRWVVRAGVVEYPSGRAHHHSRGGAS